MENDLFDILIHFGLILETQAEQISFMKPFFGLNLMH